MSEPVWFDDLPVLGRMPPDQAASKLREMGELEAAAHLEGASEVVTRGGPGGFTGWWPFNDKPWQHTSHTFGYLAPAVHGIELQPIQYVGNIVADTTLRNSRVKVTLDRLRIAAYPGGGMHRILFDFYARNQVANKAEDLHFNASFRVRQGQEAAIIGFPIFVGLNIGEEGMVFKCFTINVKNEADETFLSFLESGVFRAGLHLASTIQPAIAPLSGMAIALTRAVAKRHRNVPVQDFYMGLDFTNIAGRARLAEGSYLAVQIPQAEQANWNWSEWVYNSNNGQVIKQTNPAEFIPYNYLVFSISRYLERRR